ncbi:MAG: TRAP transporter substrate-binding protein [Pseudomonadota bacterium]
MKKSCYSMFIVRSLFFFLFILISVPAGAEDSVVELKYSNFYSSTHPNGMLSEAWCKEIEKRTNGRVKISYFGNNTLAPATQVYEAVEKGIIDIGQSVLSYQSIVAAANPRFPLSEVLDFPLGYTSGLQATKLVNEYYKRFEPVELDNTHILYLHAHGPGFLSTNKNVYKIDDIKGLRLLSTKATAGIATMLGAIPVNLSIVEAHGALSKGIIDGVLLPISPLKFWKLDEVLKTTVKNHGLSFTHSIFVTMNKKKWESLPNDIQNIFDAVSEEWIVKQGNSWDNQDKEAEEHLIKSGYKILTATPEERAIMKEKMKPLFNDYVKKTKAKSLPGDEVVKFCQNYLASQP